jgi:hypothetical protein
MVKIVLGKRGRAGSKSPESRVIAVILPRLLASNSQLAFPITAMSCDSGDLGDL